MRLAALFFLAFVRASNASCSDQSHGAVVPNPSDSNCASYLLCNGRGSGTVMPCGSGLRFNPSCSCCDWSQNVPCDGSQITQAPATATPSPQAASSGPGPSTAAPTSPSGGGGSCGSKRVVCYYPNWAYYRTAGNGKFTVDDIATGLCTHVVYAFAVLDSAPYGMKAHDSYLDITLGNFKKFISDLKQRNPNIKLLAGLGGYTDSKNNRASYKAMLGSSANRASFRQSALSFIETYGFDGLDLDYEFPDASDKTNFATWIKELKADLGPKGLELTAAISAADYHIEAGLDVASISQDLDAIHIMAYDFHGSWESMADHHSPLHKRSWDTTGFYDENTINMLLQKGAPASKLILGMPLYGQSFTLASSSSHAPPQAATGGGTPGPITKTPGYLGYNEICAKIQNEGWTEVDDVTNGPYAYSGNQWVGYDTPASMSAKTNFVIEKGLGGAMVWDLATDDFTGSCGLGKNPLLTAINTRLC